MTFLGQLLISGPPFIIAIVLHEVAHGYVAKLLGDKTASDQGRITLNPIKHIDPFLSIILPALLIFSGSPVIFGGAKAVPVNPFNFKNPRVGMAIVAAAGPITNFIIAGITLLILKTLNFEDAGFILTVIHLWLATSVMLNVILGLFNLIPVPPLDGGRIMVGILPIVLARKYAQLEKYGFYILIALLYFDVPEFFLKPAIDFVIKLLAK